PGGEGGTRQVISYGDLKQCSSPPPSTSQSGSSTPAMNEVTWTIGELAVEAGGADASTWSGLAVVSGAVAPSCGSTVSSALQAASRPAKASAANSRGVVMAASRWATARA